jgi:hypothetical protein
MITSLESIRNKRFYLHLVYGKSSEFYLYFGHGLVDGITRTPYWDVYRAIGKAGNHVFGTWDEQEMIDWLNKNQIEITK